MKEIVKMKKMNIQSIKIDSVNSSLQKCMFKIYCQPLILLVTISNIWKSILVYKKIMECICPSQRDCH